MGRVHGLNDCIFGEEPGQERSACKGKAPHSEAGRCERGEVVHAPYFPDILLVVKAVDDGAGAEEKHRLEEGVGANVEKCQLGLVKADGNHHKAELTGCGEGNDFLDVILG